jgi:Cys-tRNA(Pro) deacylase
MSKEKNTVTAAIRMLRDNKAEFKECPYKYEDKGGTAVSARELHVDEHCVIKTIVMEDELKEPLIVLMHGDKEVSTKELARYRGVKRVSTCTPDTAHKLTGYMVGGISPFGTRKKLDVYMEETILELPTIFINGGRRGLLVSIDPQELMRVLKPTLVNTAI